MDFYKYDNSYKTDIEAFIRKLSEMPVNPEKLVSNNSSEKTKRLFEFLKSIYGKKVLSGQQYLQKEELEDEVYMRYAGKLPAVRGYDLLDMDRNIGGSQITGGSQIERAVKWGKKGAIITLCWHWYAPDDIQNPENCDWSFYSMKTDYKHRTSFDLLKAVEEGNPEYAFIISRIDKAANILKQLENEDIPVLWRPLHEANGGWFWWGGYNTERIQAYKKLWYIIFDRLENYHKLTNLIWVWNGQNKDLAVNPNTYDIAGEDIYSPLPHDHSSQKEKFIEVGSYTHNKLLTLSECGYIPHPDNLIKDKVKWLWWLPWWGDFVYERDKEGKPILIKNKNPVINEKYMTPEFIKEIFNHDYVICYEDLSKGF